jgi:hypothetical protein
MKHRIFFVAVLLFTVSSITTFAQSGPLTGVVEDSAGRPVAGATVVMRNTATKAEHTATTDSEGRFSIVPDCGDKCEITVSANGFCNDDHGDRKFATERLGPSRTVGDQGAGNGNRNAYRDAHYRHCGFGQCCRSRAS